MNKAFWILVIAAVVLIYVVGTVVTLYIRRVRKLNRLARQKPPEIPGGDSGVSKELPDAEESRYIVVKDLLKKKYDSVKRSLNIPPDAALTVLRIDVFCLQNRDIAHYCWIKSGDIHLFPQWESIEADLDAGGTRNYLAGDESALLVLKISKGSVGYWRELPDGTVHLAYATKLGETADLALDSPVAQVFGKFMPEKELNYLMKHVYPKSPQNIFDIRKEFSRINRSWKKGRITDEEYYNGKKRILIMM